MTVIRPERIVFTPEVQKENAKAHHNCLYNTIFELQANLRVSYPNRVILRAFTIGFIGNRVLDNHLGSNLETCYIQNRVIPKPCYKECICTPEDPWSCIAHLSAEDMLKSVVVKGKKFKHCPWTGAVNSLGPKFWCQQEGLITMVICCTFKKNLFSRWLYTHLFI